MRMRSHKENDAQDFEDESPYNNERRIPVKGEMAIIRDFRDVACLDVAFHPRRIGSSYRDWVADGTVRVGLKYHGDSLNESVVLLGLSLEYGL